VITSALAVTDLNNDIYFAPCFSRWYLYSLPKKIQPCKSEGEFLTGPGPRRF
jgi:hypothetical protein